LERGRVPIYEEVQGGVRRFPSLRSGGKQIPARSFLPVAARCSIRYNIYMSIKKKLSIKGKLDLESLQKAIRENPIKRIRIALELSMLCFKLHQACLKGKRA